MHPEYVKGWRAGVRDGKENRDKREYSLAMHDAFWQGYCEGYETGRDLR